MALAGSLFPLLGWVLYSVLATWLERFHPSLSVIMAVQRRRWVANALHRETPMDAILSSNIMGSVSFFASTTMLVILGLFAVFGRLGTLAEAIEAIRPGGEISLSAIELHMIVVLVIFVMAFLSFTLSLRQFNHFCIMLGAADHAEQSDPTEIRVITALNTLGARNFNQGIRAYYFSIAMVVWFASPLACMAATALIFISILYREFFSASRNLVASLDQHDLPASQPGKVR